MSDSPTTPTGKRPHVVVEGERLIGLVSIGDLVKFRMDKIEAEAAAMLTYIQSV